MKTCYIEQFERRKVSDGTHLMMIEKGQILAARFRCRDWRDFHPSYSFTLCLSYEEHFALPI